MADSGAQRQSAFARTAARAGDERHKLAAAGVSLGSGVFGFAVGLCLWSAFDFEFRNPFEIVSRITLARYPKQQDIFAYAIAVLSVAGGVAAGWYAWLALAATRLRASGDADAAAIDAALARWVWPFAALLVASVPIAAARWGVAELVVMPLLVAGVAAAAARFVGTGTASPSATGEEFRREETPPGAPVRLALSAGSQALAARLATGTDLVSDCP